MFRIERETSKLSGSHSFGIEYSFSFSFPFDQKKTENILLLLLKKTEHNTDFEVSIFLSFFDSFFDSFDSFDEKAEYVWIGGGGWDMRSKCRTLDFVPTSPEQLPLWNYDGSSTEQAPGSDSEVLLKPQAIFKDPFRGKVSAIHSATQT